MSSACPSRTKKSLSPSAEGKGRHVKVATVAAEWNSAPEKSPFAAGESAIRALRSVSKAGSLYKRNPEVEAQIAAVLATSCAMWPLVVDNGFDGQRLKNETLVYMIRDCFNGDRDDVLLRLHER